MTITKLIFTEKLKELNNKNIIQNKIKLIEKIYIFKSLKRKQMKIKKKKKKNQN